MNRHLYFGLLCLMACAMGGKTAVAQGPATIQGSVHDAIGHPLAGATVRLKDGAGKVVASARSDAQGQFTFSGLASGVYVVEADRKGYRQSVRIANLATQSTARLDLVLAGSRALQIRMAARQRHSMPNAISAATGGSLYRIGRKKLAALPQGRNTPMDKVILRAPGVAQDSYGQIHVRGDHGDIQYRINDIMLPRSMTGFGQSLDTRFAQSIDLLTGVLPAQYGYRTAGVVDIRTRSGSFEKGGRVGVVGGSHNTRKLFGELGGSRGRGNYYVTASFNRNDLGLEKPTPAASVLHDRAIERHGFAYLSYMLGDTAKLSLIGGSARNDFQIPANPGQTASYSYSGVTTFPSSRLDENQHEATRYGILSLQQSPSKGLDYQVSLFSRYSQVRFSPDPVGSLIYTGVASRIHRSRLSSGVQADGSYRMGDRHTLRSGFFYSRERSINDSDSLVFPAAGGVQTGTVPFSIIDSSRKISQLYGVYLQDRWRLNGRWTLHYGVRADRVDSYVVAGQLSPRIGLVYRPRPSTTLHIGYARYFTPPPTALIAPTTIARFRNTTNAPSGSGNDPVRAQSSNYFDAGVSQQVTPWLTVGVDGYYRQVKNLLDQGQFGSAMLFTPFNYRRGRIYGVELTAAWHRDEFSGYLNLARTTALGREIISSQYNFDPAELRYIATHWIHLDHDQRLTGSGGIAWQRQGTTLSLDAIYGSGLRRGFANTGSLSPYLTFNVSLLHRSRTTPLGPVEARLSVINMFDKTYLLRDGTGVGVGAPQYGPRRAFYVAVSRIF